MRIAYLCHYGHLTVGIKADHLQGDTAKKINCIHCGGVATCFEEHTVVEEVPAHFEFYRPVIISSDEERSILDSGLLLMRAFEDPIITREFEATKGMLKLVEFMMENIEESERLPDIVDTAILHMKRSLQYKKHLLRLGQLKDQNTKFIDPNLN